jgi:hypothetical protein
MVIITSEINFSQEWSLKDFLCHPDSSGTSQYTMLSPIVVNVFNAWSSVSKLSSGTLWVWGDDAGNPFQR